MKAHSTTLKFIVVIAVLIAIVLIAVYAYNFNFGKAQNGIPSTTVTTTIVANKTLLLPTGPCSLSTTSPSNNTLLCKAGENFTGFKLLSVNSGYIQILVYNSCRACAQESSNPNQYLKIVNVPLLGSFGGACEDIYPSRLMAINLSSGVATIDFNMSSKMICV